MELIKTLMEQGNASSELEQIEQNIDQYVDQGTEIAKQLAERLFTLAPRDDVEGYVMTATDPDNGRTKRIKFKNATSIRNHIASVTSEQAVYHLDQARAAFKQARQHAEQETEPDRWGGRIPHKDQPLIKQIQQIKDQLEQGIYKNIQQHVEQNFNQFVTNNR